MSSSILTGRLDGLYDYGACGMVPLIRLDVAKPVLRNNGFACFSGHPLVHVRGLAVALLTRDVPSGRVMSWCSTPMAAVRHVCDDLACGDVYDFS